MQFSKSVLTSLLFAALAYAQADSLPPAPTEGLPEDTTGALGDAELKLNNPPGKTFIADFKDTKLKGKIKFQTSMTEGEGIHVAVELYNFPGTGGPFAYHVHDQPVPEDGNCTKTLAHLDPYRRGQLVPCDSTAPETCEVGDLAGKYGKIPETIGNATYSKSYTDNYITLEEGVGSYIGNRSVVVHLADKSRYACANIVEYVKQPHGPDSPPEEVPDNAGYKYGPGYWGCGLGAAVGLRYLLV
jgi:hypothetical protein